MTTRPNRWRFPVILLSTLLALGAGCALTEGPSTPKDGGPDAPGADSATPAKGEEPTKLGTANVTATFALTTAVKVEASVAPAMLGAAPAGLLEVRSKTGALLFRGPVSAIPRSIALRLARGEETLWAQLQTPKVSRTVSLDASKGGSLSLRFE